MAKRVKHGLATSSPPTLGVVDERPEERKQVAWAVVTSLLAGLLLSGGLVAIPFFSPNGPPADELWKWEGEFWAEVMRDATVWLLAPLTISLGLYVPVLGQSITEPPPNIRERTRVRIALIGIMVSTSMVVVLGLSVFETFANPSAGPRLVGILFMCIPTAGFGVAVGVFGVGTKAYQFEQSTYEYKRLHAWRRRLNAKRVKTTSVRVARVTQLAWIVAPLVIGVAIGLAGRLSSDSPTRFTLGGIGLVTAISTVASLATGLGAQQWASNWGSDRATSIFGGIAYIGIVGLVVVYYVTLLFSGETAVILGGILGLALVMTYLFLWLLPCVRKAPEPKVLPGSAVVVIAYRQTGVRQRERRKRLEALAAALPQPALELPKERDNWWQRFRK